MPREHLTPSTVVAAAGRLADRDGLSALTMSAVAREVGVQPASLYEHVANVAALLDAVQRQALEELAAHIGEDVAGRSAKDALTGLADAHRRYAAARPGAWQALQRPATEETAQSPGAARVAALTLAVIRGYPVPEEDRIHAARLVGATVNGFLALSRSGGFAHRPDDEDQSWTAAIAALDRALTTWSGGPA